MIIVYEIIEFIASFIELFVLYKIYNILLSKQRRNPSEKADILLSMAGAGIVRLCNHVSAFSYVTMLIFAIYIIVSVAFLYKTNYVSIFSIVSFYLVCLCCFDLFVFTCVANFYEGYETFVGLVFTTDLYRMITISAIKLLWILAYLLLKKYIYGFSLKKNYAYIILAISGMGFLGYFYLTDQTFEAVDLKITGVWFVSLAVLVLILFLAYFIIESKEEKMKLNFAEMRNQLLEENYKTINDIYMSNAKLYHDLNNHLNVLYQLLDQGNEEEAKEYITNISKPILKLSQVTWTGVDVIDVIINSKIEKMEEKGIEYDINVEFPQNTNIMPNDICTILANLLDNAIEAASKLQNSRSISLTIRKINHFLMIKVLNSCIENKNEFIQFPETTKEEKELHGWGLPSVMGTVEKYDGVLKCLNQNNQFIVKVILFFEVSVYSA